MNKKYKIKIVSEQYGNQNKQLIISKYNGGRLMDISEAFDMLKNIQTDEEVYKYMLVYSK
jgi:hypothetical protein